MRRARVRYLLVAWAAACGGSESGDTIDLTRADEGGVNGTLHTEGDDIHVVSEDRPSSDPERPGDERIVTVTAGDGSVLATWTIDLATMEIIGEFDGHPFGRDAERDMDLTYWGGVVISPAADLLDRVSEAAEAAIAGNPRAAEHLRTLAQLGPYLRKMAAPRAGAIEDCGDGVCDVDEDDVTCAEDCGCTANSCGGVAPMGCFCDSTCAERGDCCADACAACGAEIAGCPGCDGYQCIDGTCAPAGSECDGQVQCTVSEDDEDLCGSADCSDDQFACEDGQCLPLTAVCNGTDECGGGEDESVCATSRVDEPGAGTAAVAASAGAQPLAAIAVPDDPECRYTIKLRSGTRSLSSCWWRYYIQACMQDIRCGGRRPHVAVFRWERVGDEFENKWIGSDMGPPHARSFCESVSYKLQKPWYTSADLRVKTWMDYDPGVWSKKKLEAPGNDFCLF